MNEGRVLLREPIQLILLVILLLLLTVGYIKLENDAKPSGKKNERAKKKTKQQIKTLSYFTKKLGLVK